MSFQRDVMMLDYECDKLQRSFMESFRESNSRSDKSEVRPVLTNGRAPAHTKALSGNLTNTLPSVDNLDPGECPVEQQAFVRPLRYASRRCKPSVNGS